MKTSDEAFETSIADPSQDTARRRLTRSRLLAAAYEVFAEHGVRAASVEMIAERAGFTRGAFYSNFATKEELFLALEHRENKERYDRMKYGLDAVLPQLAPADGEFSFDDIDRVVAAFLDLEPDDRTWFLVEAEFRMMAMREPSVAPLFLEQQSAYLEQICYFLDRSTELVGLRFSIPTEDVGQIIAALNYAAVERAIMSGASHYDGRARAETLRTLSATLGALLVRR